MTDRDRLIELLGLRLPINVRNVLGSYDTIGERTLAVDEREKLADYLLANGVIVPPCKVGDVVYSFCDVFGAILPYVIQDFKVGFLGKDRPNYWYWEATSHATETDELLDEIDFDLDDIGKTVFLTKEEAEKALATDTNVGNKKEREG